MINLWSIHHDGNEWDEPEEFNPGGRTMPGWGNSNFLITWQ